MFCRKCGERLSDDARFCKNCGEIVLGEGIDEQKEYFTPPDVNDTSKPKTVSKKKRRTKRIKWIIIWGLLLFVFAWCILTTQFHVGLWFPEKEGLDEEENVQQIQEKGTVYSLEKDSVKLDEKTGIHYVNNIIIIFFNDGITEEDIEKVVDYLDGEIVGNIPVVNQYQIKVPANNYETLNQLCNELNQFEVVDSAMVDQAIQLSEDVIPDDPWKKTLFFLGEKWSEEEPEGSNWWQEAINSPSAWEYNDFLDPIKIGIVDNGVDINHKDLSNKIGLISSNNSIEEHGTHVAGIIGATPNNRHGITGIVWDVELLTWDWKLTEEQEDEWLYENWNTTTEIINGIIELIVNGAKVVNLSVGQTSSLVGTTRSIEDVNEQGKIASEYLVRLLEQGYDFVIVQSAGNGNKHQISVDATYNGLFCSINEDNCCTSEGVDASDIINRIIVVGAAENIGNSQYQQAYFSNAGSRVDICAPGVDIYSTVPGGYASLRGTSMAAPIVTGVASMVWAANPNLTGEEIKAIVCSEQNTKYIVEDNLSDMHPLSSAYRLVNAELAVKAAIESAEYESGELDKNPLASKEEEELEPLVFSGIIINPEDVVLKMYDSLRKGDYETAVECLRPELEEMIDFWGEVLASVLSLFTGEYISWGQLLLETGGATDVQVIECNAYNLEYNTNMGIISELLSQIPGVNSLICTEADVFVKYRYKYEDTYHTAKFTYHVKRYEWSGWRIESEY